MLDDASPKLHQSSNKPATGNGSIALYARFDHYLCLTFRSNMTASTLLHGLPNCHELLQDTPLWGPDWIAVSYDKKAVERRIGTGSENPRAAHQLIVDDIFAAIWKNLYTGTFDGRELVATPLPPRSVPEVDLGVMLHRLAQW